MTRVAAAADRGEDAQWTAVVTGDRGAFAAVASRYQRQLEVHCYRMLGSIEDAEDAVQETLLRAWRKRETYGGRATVRAWLYGIATNACLDMLDRRARRMLPPAVAAPANPFAAPLPPAGDISWLEPYPDARLDESTVDEAVIDRETIELAFLVAIQQLPPRQRAVLILRDVLGWSAQEAADVVGTTVIATNSALQRARATLRQHLPERRLEWTRSGTPDVDERQLLERYMDAWDRTDIDALVALLARDARFTMPPSPGWYAGRDGIRAFLANYPLAPGAARHVHVPVRANRQPAFLVYLADGDEGALRPFAVEVLRVVDGLIYEIDVFLRPDLVERFAVTAAV